MSWAPPRCPRCGDRTEVCELREAFAAQVKLIREKAAAAPPSARSAEPTQQPGSGHFYADQLQVEAGLVVGLLLGLAQVAAQAAVVRPAAAWWRRSVEPQMRERREKMLQQMLEAVDRHPELYYCARDDVVFVQGGALAVPSRDAGDALFRNDEARLRELLGA